MKKVTKTLTLEQWQTKITLYKDAVSDPGNGIQPTSSTWAKKHVLGMSDEEIKLDLQQQRFEKAVSKELELTPETIKKTGLFNTLDKLYGEPPTKEDTEDTTEEPGMDMGSEDVADFDMGGPETEAPGAGEDVTEPVAAAEGFNIEKDLPLILEGKGLSKDGLEDLFNRNKDHIKSINDEVDTLLD